MSNSTPTWTAEQYRRAAQAHKMVCDYMLKNIESANKDEHPKIYFEVYYLSGYVLECIMKWSLLQSKRSRKLKKDQLQEIWTHKITNLWVQVCDKYGYGKDSYSFGILADMEKKRLDWTEMRYSIGEISKLTANDFNDFYQKTVIPIFDKLREKI